MEEILKKLGKSYKQYEKYENIYKGKYDINDLDLDNPCVLDALGNYYLNFTIDYKKGIEFLEKAVELGNVDSMNTLGLYYSGLQGNDYDDLIVKYFEMAIENGNMASYCNLADFYYRKWELLKVFDVLNEGIKKKDGKCALRLARLHFNCHINYNMGKDLYLLAYKLGEDEALYWLGCLYLNKKKYVLARYYFYKSAEKGDLQAIVNMKNLCMECSDREGAFKYAFKGMEKGHSESIGTIAKLYSYNPFKKKEYDDIYNYRKKEMSNDFIRKLQLKYSLKWFDYMANPYTERGKRYVERRYNESFDL